MSDQNTSLPVRTEQAGDVEVKIVDGLLPSQKLTVNPDGSVNITDNNGSLTVDALDLDIRDLSAAQDNVAISDGTNTLEINPDGSINAVVSATDLDIRDLDAAQDSVEIIQATHDNVNVNANIQVADVDVSNANPVPVSDAGGSLTVDAIDLDIRDLTHVSDSVKIGDGVDFLAVNPDGSINVVPQEDPGTEIVDFNQGTAVAALATSIHDLLFPTESMLHQVFASASGKLKIEVQIETGATTGIFETILVAFNSTAAPNIDATLKKYALIPAGARVRVIRTNRDLLPQDVYSSIVAIIGL